MSMDLGLLILRVVVGLFLVGHGAQKLFGWFGGYGIAGTAGWLGSLGLRPGGFWTVVGGLSEFAGGLLLALGLFSPLGALGIIAAMVTAIALFHWPKVWGTEGGFEYPFVLMAAALAATLTGPGSYSLDSLLGTSLPMPGTLLGGLALVVLGVIITLAARSRTVITEQAEPQQVA